MTLSSENRIFRSDVGWIIGALALLTLVVRPSWDYLIRLYLNNPLESHSLWILMLACFLLFRESKEIKFERAEGNAIGLVSVLFFISLYTASVIADINLIAAILSIGLVGAVIHTLLGWDNLKKLLFPLFMILLSLPINTAIDLALGFDVRLFSAKLSFEMLHFMGLARELMGTKIIMTNNVLAVDSSCSGLRTLSVLIVMNLVMGYLMFKKALWKRIVLVLAAIVIAGLANSLRITTIGVVAHQYGLNYAMGIMHTYSGLAIFTLSLILFWPVYVYLGKK
jgi:exosortase